MGTDKFDDELVARFKARAADPDRRTNASGIGSQTVDVGSLLGQIGAGQGAALQGFMGQFANVMKGFGVVNPMPVGDRATGRDPAPLPPPATAELFEKWLSEPTAMERMRQSTEDMMRDPMGMHVRNLIESYGTMSPAERAAQGLPEEGWEDEVRRRFGKL